MSDKIEYECVVRCSSCGESERASTSNKLVAAETFRNSDWRLTREEGWLCPSCEHRQEGLGG